MVQKAQRLMLSGQADLELNRLHRVHTHLNVASCVCTQGGVFWSELGPGWRTLELLWSEEMCRRAVVDVYRDVIPERHERLRSMCPQH